MSISFTVSFAIACFLSSVSVSTPVRGTTATKHETAVPEWRVNLKSAIGSPSLGKVFGRVREYKALPRTSLWFTDNNTLIASFVIRADKGDLSGRDDMDATLPLRLRLLSIDSATGHVQATSDWPTDSRDAGVIAVHNGRFVTQRGSELTLYTPEMKPLKMLKLPPLTEGDWVAYTSPSGKNILFIPSGHKTGTWLWLETDAMQILHSWEEDKQTGSDVAIADDKIAMTTCKWSHECEPQIRVRGIATDWKTIAPGSRESYPQFVNDNMLLLSGSSIKLIQAGGSVVLDEDLPYVGCLWGKVSLLTNGQRFVVPRCIVKGAIAALDIGPRAELKEILVYDSPFEDRLHALDLKGPAIKDLALLALSPNGLKLAVLNSNWLEVLQLPPMSN